MKRRAMTTKFVTKRADGLYVEKTVTSMVGGGKPAFKMKEVVHPGVLREVKLEDGPRVGEYDITLYSAEDFTPIYLKRIS